MVLKETQKEFDLRINEEEDKIQIAKNNINIILKEQRNHADSCER